MSLTNVAMLGILLGFVFLVVGFLMEGPQSEIRKRRGTRPSRPVKKGKKRVSRMRLTETG